MQQPSYATEQDVYDVTGLTSEAVQRLTEKSASEVTDLINNYIITAEQKVKSLLRIPWVIRREVHYGTGEDDEFDLGPEDEDFYIPYDPIDKVDMIHTCYFMNKRKKKPYPKRTCDLTEDASDWDSTGFTAPTDEHVIKQAGDFSMKFDWLGGVGTGRYPDVTSGVYLDKNIDIFDFMFCRLRSDTAGIVVTITLYSMSGESTSCTFTCTIANRWYKVMMDLDDDFSYNASLDWDDDHLGYITITVSDVCTLYVDNLNFNDEWCFTAPSGKLVIMHRSTDEPPYEGYCFCVTYSYDPYQLETPQNVATATAQFAGVKLIDHLIGVRQQGVAFEMEGESMIPVPDKETLYHTRGYLMARAKENLAEIGYGFEFTPVVVND